MVHEPNRGARTPVASTHVGADHADMHSAKFDEEPTPMQSKYDDVESGAASKKWIDIGLCGCTTESVEDFREYIHIHRVWTCCGLFMLFEYVAVIPKASILAVSRFSQSPSSFIYFVLFMILGLVLPNVLFIDALYAIFAVAFVGAIIYLVIMRSKVHIGLAIKHAANVGYFGNMHFAQTLTVTPEEADSMLDRWAHDPILLDTVHYRTFERNFNAGVGASQQRAGAFT